MTDFTRSPAALPVVLDPFPAVLYPADMVGKADRAQFAGGLTRAVRSRGRRR